MELIVFQGKIFEPETEDIPDGWVQLHHRRRIWSTRQLQPGLFDMIVVEVDIPEGVNEFTGLETANLRDHEGEQCVGGDIERHPEKNIGAALIKLAAQPLLTARVGRHIELEKDVTGHQRHFRKIGHVPRADDETATVRCLPDLPDQLADLVDRSSAGPFPTAPLFAVYGSQLSVGIGPFIPDADPMFFKEPDIRLAPQEPKKLVDDAFSMQFLGRHQRKAPGEIEPQLMTKTTEGSGAGTVRLPDAFIENMLKKIEVLLHGCNLRIFVIPKPPSLRLLRVNNFSSEPSLKPGKLFLTTRIKKPGRFDLISYRAILPQTGITILTHRLCGIPGDTLELKGGVLYVNGQEADGSLTLKHIYKVSVKDAGSLEYDPKQFYVVPPYTDTLYISLEDKYVKDHQLPFERYVLPRGLRDEDIYLQYKQNWNRDHFGPLRIPPGKFFVLGDNRGNSRDSRYLGLIEQSKYIGTVWWK